MTTQAQRRTQANAAAAIARAQSHIPPPADQTEDEQLAELYPYVSHARAKQIRQEAEEDRHA